MNRIIYMGVILFCSVNLNAQSYLIDMNKCEREVYKIEYEVLYGEVVKYIYVNFYLNEDTLYSIKAESVHSDTLQLSSIALIDNSTKIEWYYVWNKYYNSRFLAFISKIEKKCLKGICKTYKLFREDEKSVRRFSDYSQTPEFEEYYNFEERVINTEIILTFPKFFKEIQGVKEE